MKKIIFILFFFIILPIELNSKEINFQNFDTCYSNNKKNFIANYDKKVIKLIDIDINNYRKWTKNNIKIFTSNSRWISDKFKKRFNSTVKVVYDDNTLCVFKAKVRHSGDAKDHIEFKENSILQSLDVSLVDGNIKGIVNFKLFKPDARGNLEDVILVTEILRHLGYLAPRSSRVKVQINDVDSIMLFQEKAEKELLEFNNRREGPILESDQKFFFKLVENIPYNNKSNWSLGVPFLQNKSSLTMLSKSTNGELIKRSPEHKKIFLKSLDNLNLIYLYWSNRFKDEKNDYFYFDYDLDNNLLAFFDETKIENLNLFNIFMTATNSQHGLSVSNRKFYWNSIENFFEPIYYDGNPDISLEKPSTTTYNIRYPISKDYMILFSVLEKRIKKLNINSIFKNIKYAGLDISLSDLEFRINIILKNLYSLEKMYEKNINNEIRLHNNFIPIKNLTEKFTYTLNEIDPNAQIVFFDIKKNLFKACDNSFNKCEYLNLDDKDISDLINADYKKDNKNYVYLGSDLNLEILQINKDYNYLKIDNSNFFYENDIEVNIDKENYIIDIVQKKPGARAYFINGKIENYSINFKGYSQIFKSQNNLNSELPPNYPINKNNLTGCLSLVNLDTANINFSISNTNCEDALNLINVKGSINKIKIENSFSDGLDVDFSNLKIKDIIVSNSGNDCTDFSAGNYVIENFNLNKCGDKGISVGEKSLIKINIAYIDNINIGVASKDSSITNINKVSVINSDICVAAYKKKQEFYGGVLEANELKCDKYIKLSEFDDYSIVNLN